MQRDATREFANGMPFTRVGCTPADPTQIHRRGGARWCHESPPRAAAGRAEQRPYPYAFSGDERSTTRTSAATAYAPMRNGTAGALLLHRRIIRRGRTLLGTRFRRLELGECVHCSTISTRGSADPTTGKGRVQGGKQQQEHECRSAWPSHFPLNDEQGVIHTRLPSAVAIRARHPDAGIASNEDATSRSLRMPVPAEPQGKMRRRKTPQRIEPCALSAPHGRRGTITQFPAIPLVTGNRSHQLLISAAPACKDIPRPCNCELVRYPVSASSSRTADVLRSRPGSRGRRRVDLDGCGVQRGSLAAQITAGRCIGLEHLEQPCPGTRRGSSARSSR